MAQTLYTIMSVPIDLYGTCTRWAFGLEATCELWFWLTVKVVLRVKRLGWKNHKSELVSNKSLLKMDESSKLLKRLPAPPQSLRQKIDVYVQYLCFPPAPALSHPPTQAHLILKMFCYATGIMRYDQCLLSVCCGVPARTISKSCPYHIS